MMDLERITKVVRSAPDRAIPRRRTTFYETWGKWQSCALCSGWSRQAAEMLKEWCGARDLEASPEALEAEMLAAA